MDTSMPGTYVLIYNYTDSSGNAAQEVTRTVTVVDTTVPVISLIGDDYLAHEAGSEYIDADASWTDLVDGRACPLQPVKWM